HPEDRDLDTPEQLLHLKNVLIGLVPKSDEVKNFSIAYFTIAGDTSEKNYGRMFFDNGEQEPCEKMTIDEVIKRADKLINQYAKPVKEALIEATGGIEGTDRVR